MNQILPTLLLVLITVVWGWSFVLVKNAIAAYGVMSFLVVRFIIASLVMAPYSARKVTRSAWFTGIPIGLVLAASYVTQTIGLQWTTATNSGLITGLFIVFVPAANRAIFGIRTSWTAWAAIAVSFVGLALLTDSERGVLNVGDALTLAGAAFLGLFIALLDHYAARHNAAGFAFIQVLVSMIGFLVVWPMVEPVRLPTREVWFALLLTGVVSTGAGAIIQNYAQQHLPAIRTAVIIALTPVWAATFGILAAGDRLNTVQVAGAVLMLGAVMMVEVLGSNGKKPAARPEVVPHHGE